MGENPGGTGTCPPPPPHTHTHDLEGGRHFACLLVIEVGDFTQIFEDCPLVPPPPLAIRQ